MTLHTDKDLKSKNVRGKKVYILAKDIDQEENLKSKPKTFQLEKGLFFGSPLFWQLCPKRLDSFTKYLQNIITLKNQPLPITTSRDKRGGGQIGSLLEPNFI